MDELKESDVVFLENPHQYILNGLQLQGITSTIIPWLFPDTYVDIPQGILDIAAEHGRKVHKAIEMLQFVGADPNIPESKWFADIMQANKLYVITNEYLVSDEKKFASKIDNLLTRDGENIIINDTKCTSKLYVPEVTAQLNVYAYLFGLMNPTIPIEGISVTWLPKEQYGKPCYKELRMLEPTAVRQMLEAYTNGEDATPYRAMFAEEEEATGKTEALPIKYVEMADMIATAEETMKTQKEQYENMKAQLLAAMRQYGVKQWKTDRLTITYVAPTTRQNFDKKRFEEDHPDIYEQYVTESEVADSVRIRTKKTKKSK